MVRTIGKLPISYFVWIFVGYMVGHIVIGLLQKKYAKELKKNPSDADVQNYDKWFTVLFMWFPVLYLIIMVLSFYI